MAWHRAKFFAVYKIHRDLFGLALVTGLTGTMERTFYCLPTTTACPKTKLEHFPGPCYVFVTHPFLYNYCYKFNGGASFTAKSNFAIPVFILVHGVHGIIYFGSNALSPAALVFRSPSLYQGIGVVASWWGLQPLRLIIGCGILSALLNIAFGFLTFRLLMQLSPSYKRRLNQSGQRKKIFRHFIAPLLLVFPVALLLSFPHSITFFACMFLQSVLWLPGLIMKSQDDYQYTGVYARSSKIANTYRMGLVALITGILIRVFL